MITIIYIPMSWSECNGIMEGVSDLHMYMFIQFNYTTFSLQVPAMV